jgi:aliphatic sulfonates family ABC transporter substrate-binding protein
MKVLALRRWSPLWVSLSMLAMAVSGCGNSGSSNTAGENSTTGNNATSDTSSVQSITVGYNPTIAQPQPLVGLHSGSYASEMPGISVNGRDYDAGPAVLEALRAGVIQIGCSGPFPAVKAYAKDGDVVLLCGTAAGGTELMVAKDSPFKTVKDLKGKIIGVNQPGSTVEAMVRYNLVQAGLSPDKDVKIIEVKPAEQADALKRGDVQAVAAPAPWPSDVAINGNGRALLNWKQIYGNGKYLAGSFYTTKKFAEENPELIQKFIAATQKITDRLNADRTKGDAEVLAAWSKVTRKTLKPEVAKAAFATMTYTTAADEAALQKFADVNHELGLLKKKADLKGFVWQAPQK